METTAEIQPSFFMRFLVKVRDIFMWVTLRPGHDTTLSWFLWLPIVPVAYLTGAFGLVFWVIYEVLARLLPLILYLSLMALPILVVIACGCVIFSVL